MAAYIGSTPTAPLDPGTIEFVKGKPAIVQPAKDLSYYKEQWQKLDQKHDAERRQFLAEFKSSGTWRGEYKSWQQCCVEYLNLSKRRVDKLVEEANVKQSREGGHPASDKSDTLDKLSTRPDPKEEEPEKPHVRSGDEILAELTAEQWEKEHYNVKPKPKAVQAPADKQPRAERVNGKPIYALPVWKDLLDFYGHALNRLGDANRVVPDRQLYETMEAKTKELMNKSREWREKARK